MYFTLKLEFIYLLDRTILILCLACLMLDIRIVLQGRQPAVSEDRHHREFHQPDDETHDPRDHKLDKSRKRNYCKFAVSLRSQALLAIVC